MWRLWELEQYTAWGCHYSFPMTRENRSTMLTSDNSWCLAINSPNNMDYCSEAWSQGAVIQFSGMPNQVRSGTSAICNFLSDLYPKKIVLAFWILYLSSTCMERLAVVWIKMFYRMRNCLYHQKK